MKSVTFQKSYDKYNPGETAGFSDAVADSLIERKVARPAAPKASAGGQDKQQKAAVTK
jgi:hypothetical protein